MKLVVYIWCMSFLIGFCVTACGKRPDTIKAEQESKAKCQAECSSVNRTMDEFATGFGGVCKCKGSSQ